MASLCIGRIEPPLTERTPRETSGSRLFLLVYVVVLPCQDTNRLSVGAAWTWVLPASWFEKIAWFGSLFALVNSAGCKEAGPIESGATTQAEAFSPREPKPICNSCYRGSLRNCWTRLMAGPARFDRQWRKSE